MDTKKKKIKSHDYNKKTNTWYTTSQPTAALLPLLAGVSTLSDVA